MFDTFTQKFPRDYTAAYTICCILPNSIQYGYQFWLCSHCCSDRYFVEGQTHKCASYQAQQHTFFTEIPHQVTSCISLVLTPFIRASAWDFQQCSILTCVDSDELLQHPFKLRNSKWCSVSSLTIIEYSNDQQRLWSDCAHAQADLRLCWSHIPHCWKSHVMAQL